MVDTLNPGRHAIRVGVWNSVTQRKLPFELLRPETHGQHHAVVIGERIVDADSASSREDALRRRVQVRARVQK